MLQFATILNFVVDTMQLVSGVLALAAASLTVAMIGARLLAARERAVWRAARWVSERSMWAIAAIAVCATAGSLYFSEFAEMVPCRLCWFQRILMYPIAVIGVVALARRDSQARWYTASLAAIGAAISSYHVFIEWNPQHDSATCELFGPACSVIYFRTFGFMSLATMALCGFIAVLTLSVVNFPGRNADRATI